MSDFTGKIKRFMSGRYGTDALNKTVFWTYIVIIIVNAFLHLYTLNALALILAVIYLYRAFSRNTVRRSAENRKFLSVCTAVYGAFSRLFKKGDAEHVFRKCANCGVKLRLPHRRGIHTVRCPHCGKTFDVRILF